jgi:tRNA pseudouridine32 synthase / 23S rRNA pseudouridine746 synthase
VVDKPAGQLSVPGRGPLAAGSVASQLQARWPEALTVHRLDMATSGLLLFARGPALQRRFSTMFAERAIDKRYVAIVHGRLGAAPGSTGSIALPLAADWPNRPRQRVDEVQGKPSLSHWEVLAHDPAGAWTRLALRPVTGRSHQLRVHLMAIGHPIVGDGLYGPPDAAAPRLMLHAEGLAFQHPVEDRTITLHAEAPF